MMAMLILMVVMVMVVVVARLAMEKMLDRVATIQPGIANLP